MGTISVSLPADGTTADVADVNTPITTIVNAINGNLDNTNLVSGAAIATSKLATDNGITGNMLANTAISLGFASSATNFSTASATAVQITGLSATVTIPTGTRRIRITAHIPSAFATAAANSTYGIWDGTVGSGTLLNQGTFTTPTNGYISPITIMAVSGSTAFATPANGSKTYNVSLSTSGTSQTLATTGTMFILVEAL